VKLDELAAVATPYLPPAFGAFIGLVNARNQTPSQRVLGYVVAFGISVYFTPAIAEFFGLGPKAIVALGVLVAVIGGDVVGGFIAAAAAFKADPLNSFKNWLSAWFSRGGGQ
jgi:hypothetical protein